MSSPTSFLPEPVVPAPIQSNFTPFRFSMSASVAKSFWTAWTGAECVYV
jgi:hypothetical protein